MASQSFEKYMFLYVPSVSFISLRILFGPFRTFRGWSLLSRVGWLRVASGLAVSPWFTGCSFKFPSPPLHVYAAVGF